VGPSRKSFIGELTGQVVSNRELGTAAAVTASILKGAHLVRVHAVRVQLDAVRIADALKRAE
jgi:dihydropteroate synthase